MRTAHVQRPLHSWNAACLLLTLELLEPYRLIGVMLQRGLRYGNQRGLGGVVLRCRGSGVLGTGGGGFERGLSGAVLGTQVGKNLWWLGGGVQGAWGRGLQGSLGHGVVWNAGALHGVVWEADGVQKALADGVQRVTGGVQRGATHCQEH